MRKKKKPPSYLGITIIIAICLLLMLIQQFQPSNTLSSDWSWNNLNPHLDITVSNSLIKAFTAIFIHTDWAHLLGNLAFFWLFGIAIERFFTALGIIFSFSMCGALSNILTALTSPSITHLVGSSGAVAGMMGIYLALFPRASIGIYLPLGFFLQQVKIPAYLLMSIWFIIQFAYSVSSIDASSLTWQVHIYGFCIGLIIGFIYKLFD